MRKVSVMRGCSGFACVLIVSARKSECADPFCGFCSGGSSKAQRPPPSWIVEALFSCVFADNFFRLPPTTVKEQRTCQVGSRFLSFPAAKNYRTHRSPSFGIGSLDSFGALSGIEERLREGWFRRRGGWEAAFGAVDTRRGDSVGSGCVPMIPGVDWQGRGELKDPRDLACRNCGATGWKICTYRVQVPRRVGRSRPLSSSRRIFIHTIRCRSSHQ